MAKKRLDWYLYNRVTKKFRGPVKSRTVARASVSKAYPEVVSVDWTDNQYGYVENETKRKR